MKFIVIEDRMGERDLVRADVAAAQRTHLNCDCQRIELTETAYLQFRDLRGEATELLAMADRIIEKAEKNEPPL